jgi:hypothetical protein
MVKRRYSEIDRYNGCSNQHSISQIGHDRWVIGLAYVAEEMSAGKRNSFCSLCWETRVFPVNTFLYPRGNVQRLYRVRKRH